VQALRDRIVAKLQERLDGVHVNGDATHRLPATVNLGIEGIDGARLVALAGEEGIAIAAGSACTTTGMAPSHVLTAMNLPEPRVHGGVRISLSRYNTDAAAERLWEVLPALVQRIRAGAA
jgi:cysteine desulfurase